MVLPLNRSENYVSQILRHADTIVRIAQTAKYANLFIVTFFFSMFASVAG